MYSTVSVAQLLETLKESVEYDPRFRDIWVEGEVSGFKKYASSGHFYFSLKGVEVQLSCAMWRTYAERQAYIPRDGDAVVAHGRLEIYAVRGEVKLIVDLIQPAGVGDLYAQFEALKRRLSAEGLFDEERKRPLNPFPQVIGIVTSANAAALQDVLKVLRRRCPLVQVILSPCSVQGDQAPPTIIRAIERLNTFAGIDTILVCRGGGSIEDLWAFNDEGVARAIASSRIPVVTGIGHEIDFTIADFVSDHRSPTPSAAAEEITPDIEMIRAETERTSRALIGAMQYLFKTQRKMIADQTQFLQYRSPEGKINTSRQRIDDWSERLERAYRHQTVMRQERLTSRNAALEAASPYKILERGYAIISDVETGQRITSVQNTPPQQTLNIQFKDGSITATVGEESP